MRPSRYSLLALSIVLLAAPALGGASAQTTNDQQYDWKPYIPPLMPVPPNAKVNPGSLTAAPLSGGPAPLVKTSPVEEPRAPGLTITIPTPR